MLGKISKTCVSIGLSLLLGFSAMTLGSAANSHTVMAASDQEAVAVDPTGRSDGYSAVLYDILGKRTTR